jgi:hypothetical protein
MGGLSWEAMVMTAVALLKYPPAEGNRASQKSSGCRQEYKWLSLLLIIASVVGNIVIQWNSLYSSVPMMQIYGFMEHRVESLQTSRYKDPPQNVCDVTFQTTHGD